MPVNSKKFNHRPISSLHSTQSLNNNYDITQIVSAKTMMLAPIEIPRYWVKIKEMFNKQKHHLTKGRIIALQCESSSVYINSISTNSVYVIISECHWLQVFLNLQTRVMTETESC